MTVTYRCYYDRKLQRIVEVPLDAPTRKAAQSTQVMRDLPAYKSPLGDGVIEGRAARREHFKRTNTREVDPSEFKPAITNPHFARKWGLEVTGEAKKPTRWNTYVDRNWKEG